MNRKKTNVLFVGHFGAKNIGDELLLRAEIDLLYQAFPEGIRPFVYSYNVNTTYYNDSPYEIQQIQGFSFRSFFSAISQIIKCVKNIDLIIVGGGGIIQDKYFVYRPLSTLLPALLGFIYNKPVYGFSLGIYKINLSINKKIFQSFVKYARFITYRDKTSEDNIKINSDSTINENIFLIPDSALAIPKKELLSTEKNVNTTPYIAITIREVFAEYLDDLIDLIKSQAYNINVSSLKLIAFEDTVSEYEVLESLKNKLKSNFDIEIISFPSLKSYMLLLDNASLILAGRLHGCIPSYVLGKNIIGLAYEEKVSDFCLTHQIPFAYIDNLKEINDGTTPIKTLNREIIELTNYAQRIKETCTDQSKLSSWKKISLLCLLLEVLSVNMFIHLFKIDYKKNK